MTTDDIIRMAREADLWGEIYAMQRFASLVAAAEREACAKVCEAVADEEVGMAYAGIALCCADNIRARGQSKPETVSPAEHRRRTNSPWNDKASY